VILPLSIALVVGRHAGSIFLHSGVVRGSTIGGGRRGLLEGSRAVGGKRMRVGLYARSESGRQHLAQHDTNKKQAGLARQAGPQAQPWHDSRFTGRAAPPA
jgi:hypothetical protein